jgi:hypothetical protein
MKPNNPFSAKKHFTDQGLQHNNKFYFRFADDDVEQLQFYCEDLGYDLIPEQLPGEPNYDPLHPIRFKVVSRRRPDLFGWISKGTELVYGFYQGKTYKDKYPISWQVEHRLARRFVQHNRALASVEDFRFAFGITDLETDTVESQTERHAVQFIRHALRSWYHEKRPVLCSQN